MSGNARAFTRKLQEYQQQNSAAGTGVSSGGGIDRFHRPLSQQSSSDVINAAAGGHPYLRSHAGSISSNSGLAGLNGPPFATNAHGHLEEQLLQMIADPMNARNSLRSAAASSRTGSVSGVNQVLGGPSNAHSSGVVTPSQSNNYIAKMSADNNRYYMNQVGVPGGLEYLGATLTETVPDPVDFEAVVAQSACAELADYPYNDLQVEVIAPPDWVSGASFEREFGSVSLSSQVADCIEQYRKQLFLVHRQHAHFSPQFSNTQCYTFKVLRLLSPLRYEGNSGEDTLTRPASSLFLQSKVAETDPPLENFAKLLKNDLKLSLQKCREVRSSQRFPELMSLFLLDIAPPAIERSLKVDFDQKISHLSIRFQSYDPKVNFEPLFFSIFLYDLNSRKKLSETFHFDQNDDFMIQRLRQHLPSKIDSSTKIQEAIFSLSHSTDELYIVIRVEKVLQPGDIQSACDPYLHPEKSAKSIDKLKTQSSFWCDNLGAYRMPFAWTATNLISAINSSENQAGEISYAHSFSTSSEGAHQPDNLPEMSGTDSVRSHSSSSLGRKTSSSISNRFAEGGSGSNKSKTQYRPSLFRDDDTFSNFLNNFYPMDLRFKSFFVQDLDKMTDEDISNCLADFKRDRGKRFKSFDMEVSLEVKPVSLPFSRCLTSDLQSLNCQPGETPTAKLFLEFPVLPVAKPHSSYINLLYVYPKVLNLSSKPGTARNILMKVRLIQGQKTGPVVLKSVFGKSTDEQLKEVAYCPVSYHCKVPKFYDEIKIQLPPALNELHHLQFEFYHITCNLNKKVDSGDQETFVGATWLPLLDDYKRLIVGEVSLPVSSDKLPSDYFCVHPRVPLPSIKWLDGHKELFTLSLNAHSSVHTMDEYLDKFLNQYAIVFNPKNSQISKQEIIRMGSLMAQSTVDLREKVSIGSLIQFLYVILNKLLSLIVRNQSICGEPSIFTHNAFEALVAIVGRLHSSQVQIYVDGFNRSHLLLSYINKNLDLSDFQYDSNGEKVFDAAQVFLAESLPGVARKTLHSELLIQIMSTKNDREKLMTRIWFFFEIIIKSLAHENLQNLETGLPRLHTFDDCLNGDMGSVISNVTEHIYKLNKTGDHKTAGYLNYYLAFFVSDLFSVCNRTWVFNYIKSYVIRMNSFIDALRRDMNSDPTPVVSLKLEFLRVVCTHEHFVTLNLPFSQDSGGNVYDIPSFRASVISSVSQVSSSTLSADSVVGDTLSVEFKQTHFLMGLLLQELKLLLPTAYLQLQKSIITIICQVSQFIDRDKRYQQPFVKAKVVSLFMPLIKIIVTNKECLSPAPKPYLDSAFRNSAEATSALESAMSKIAGMEPTTQNAQPKNQLNADLSRNLLSLFLWTFKNLDPELLINWWLELSETSLIKLVQVIGLCVSMFEYRGRDALNKEAIKSEEVKQKIEGLFFGNIGARNDMIMRRKQSAMSSKVSSTTSSLGRARWEKSMEYSNSIDASDENDRLVFESNICCESVLVCLDLTDYILEIISFGGYSNALIKECVGLLTDVLSRNQTKIVYMCCLDLLRVAIKEHAQFIILEDWELCSNLCLRLLRTSCSKESEVRIHATSCLYLIMRLCFDFSSTNSLSRLKIQLIVALSSLVSLLDHDKAINLQKSMKSLSSYSSKDTELINTTFPSQIEDLVGNLQGILLNTIKMQEFVGDPEMHMDLMYRVAKGYQSSIDLRLTWLRNMELKNRERDCFAEAAMCLLHSAALVCEGLYSIDQNEEIPIGATEFEDISENVLEECILDYNTQNCFAFNHNLSKDGLVMYLEKAANCFYKANLFELAIKCYEHLLSIHRTCRNYTLLSEYYKKIETNCEKITNLDQSGKRSFSTFFRVGFYGAKFEDMNGKEFVYKEGPYAQLSVISSRLESFYAERLGENVVELLKTSNLVDQSSLNLDKAYIQITYVEPFFDYYKDVELVSQFERNVNMHAFAYNIPFTKSGRPHGSLKEQFKKRVVLFTQQSFPYLKTRLEVIGRTEEILSPLKVAKEDLTKKLEQFEAVLRIPSFESQFYDSFSDYSQAMAGAPTKAVMQQPVDGKRLQLILQGCIGTQVNQGPTEIALTFLNVDDIDAEGDGEWTIEHDDLRLLFKKFLRLCKRGLAENRKLIKADQVEYEQQLQRDFEKMKSIVGPLLHNRGPGWIRSNSEDEDFPLAANGDENSRGFIFSVAPSIDRSVEF